MIINLKIIRLKNKKK